MIPAVLPPPPPPAFPPGVAVAVAAGLGDGVGVGVGVAVGVGVGVAVGDGAEVGVGVGVAVAVGVGVGVAVGVPWRGLAESAEAFKPDWARASHPKPSRQSRQQVSSSAIRDQFFDTRTPFLHDKYLFPFRSGERNCDQAVARSE